MVDVKCLNITVFNSINDFIIIKIVINASGKRSENEITCANISNFILVELDLNQTSFFYGVEFSLQFADDTYFQSPVVVAQTLSTIACVVDCNDDRPHKYDT